MVAFFIFIQPLCIEFTVIFAHSKGKNQDLLTIKYKCSVCSMNVAENI